VRSGIRHVAQRGMDRKELVATWKDLLVAGVMVVFLASAIGWRSRPRTGPPPSRPPPGGAADHGSMGLASRAEPAYKVNQMVQYPDGRLDASFAALSDATRRGVLERLGRGDASITDLAGAFRMTLTGMRKHVGVLEQAGLVTTEKVGRVRTCRLGPRRLEAETAWIEQQRRLWDARFDQLEQVVAQRRRKEQVDGHPKRR